MPFRSMRVGDLPQLLRFERSYMQTIEPESLVAWTAAIDRNLQLWIDCLPTSGVITDENGAIAGMALWQVDLPVATLVAVHVAAEQRRRGLGGELTGAFLAAAEASGAERAALGVHDANPGAERLYLAQGFHRVGRDGSYRLYERELREGGTG